MNKNNNESLQLFLCSFLSIHKKSLDSFNLVLILVDSACIMAHIVSLDLALSHGRFLNQNLMNAHKNGIDNDGKRNRISKTSTNKLGNRTLNENQKKQTRIEKMHAKQKVKNNP